MQGILPSCCSTRAGRSPQHIIARSLGQNRGIFLAPDLSLDVSHQLGSLIVGVFLAINHTVLLIGHLLAFQLLVSVHTLGHTQQNIENQMSAPPLGDRTFKSLIVPSVHILEVLSGLHPLEVGHNYDLLCYTQSFGMKLLR